MLKDDYHTYLKELGQNIRLIRKNRGLSMEALANIAEIEYRQLGRIERGEGNTSIVSLLKLSAALEVHISQFF